MRVWRNIRVGFLRLVCILSALAFLIGLFFWGWYFLSPPAKRAADAARPLAEHGSLAFPTDLFQTEAGYLLAYHSSAQTLNVYDETDSFVCSYRIPCTSQGGGNQAHACQGDVYIQTGRGLYRYGPQGEYLGVYQYDSINKGRLYDAHGQPAKTWFNQTTYDVIAFTDTEIFTQNSETGEWAVYSSGRRSQPAEPLDTQKTDGGYFTLGTTLYGPDGTKIDSSPWTDIFRYAPYLDFFLLLFGQILYRAAARRVTELWAP